MAMFRTALFALVAALFLATAEARMLRSHSAPKPAANQKVVESADDKAEDVHEAAEDAEDAKEDAEDDAEESKAPVVDVKVEAKPKVVAAVAAKPAKKKQMCGKKGDRECVNPLSHNQVAHFIGEVDEVMEDQEAERGMPIEESSSKAKQEAPVPVVEAPLAEGMEKIDHNKVKEDGVYNPITGQVESFLQTGDDDETEELDEDDAKVVSDDSEEEESVEAEDSTEDEQQVQDEQPAESQDITESGEVSEQDDVTDSEQANNEYNQAEEQVFEGDEVSFVQVASKDDDNTDELDEDDAKIAQDDDAETEEQSQSAGRDDLAEESDESNDVQTGDSEREQDEYNHAEEEVLG